MKNTYCSKGKYYFTVTTPGDIIKHYIKINGITQRELAKRTGMGEQKISRLVRGKARITPKIAIKLADAMPISLLADEWYRLEYEHQLYLMNYEREKL